MRRLLIFLACLAVGAALVPPVAAQVSDYSYARVVRLSLVEGDVQVYRPEEDGWRAGLINLPLQQGYVVSTAFGRAEIEFESGAIARIAENSVLQFTELALSGGGRITQLTLTHGTGTFYANLSRLDSFVVLTPHLQVSIPDNARFRVDVTAEETTVGVLKGEVSVETRQGSYRLAKGSAMTFFASSEQMVTASLAADDEWDRWVSDREEVVSRGRDGSLRYARAPFSYGLSDLWHYGSWLYVPGYGYGWQPAGVPIGWSPYWNGQWIFVRGIGWTWLSFERWGWVPYHFGRWAFTGAGWAWIPGHFNTWHPGHVRWVQFGNRVGWVPRGPHDRHDDKPEHLPRGVITRRGTLGPTVNERVEVDDITKATVLAEAPMRFADVDVRRPSRGGSGGAAIGGVPALPERGEMPAAPHVTAGEPPTRSRTGAIGGRSTIVFDSEEQRFINNPNLPARQDAESPALPARPAVAPPADTLAPRSVPSRGNIGISGRAPSDVSRGADSIAPDVVGPRRMRGREFGGDPGGIPTRSGPSASPSRSESRGEMGRPSAPRGPDPGSRGTIGPSSAPPQRSSPPPAPPPRPSVDSSPARSSPPPPPPARPPERPPKPDKP